MTGTKATKAETILLADHDAGTRETLATTLKDAGYRVITADDGHEALDQFHRHAPQIVLPHIQLPGMSGMDLLRMIKDQRPNTEVIMLTGQGDMALAIKSLKMNATDFVTKPINNDILEIALNRAHQRMEMRHKVETYTRQLEEKVREKESHLNASRQSYQQLFDLSPCYITVQNQKLELTAANQRFTTDFDGRIGMHCYQAYKHRSSPCPQCPVENTFADGKPHQSEMVVTTKDGAQCHLYISTAPITDSAGKTTQVIEMSTNITELRHLQDRLASLGLHMSSISHGIKGLLTHLDGGLYLLKTGFEQHNQPKSAEGLEIVQFAAQRIRRMILDILYFAKERPLQVESVDAAKFVHDIVTVFQPRLKAHPIQFGCNIDDHAGRLNVDATVMRTALLNILDNAADACIDHPSQPDRKVIFGMQRKSDYIIFDIVDNGIGMDKETVDNLFDLFFSSKGHRGTGIGLFVAHQIITQHDGTIHVSSKKGQGSHFRVVLPDQGDVENI